MIVIIHGAVTLLTRSVKIRMECIIHKNVSMSKISIIDLLYECWFQQMLGQMPV